MWSLSSKATLTLSDLPKEGVGNEVWTKSFDYNPLEEKEGHDLLLIHINGQRKRNWKNEAVEIKSTTRISFESTSHMHANHLGVLLNYESDSVGLGSDSLHFCPAPSYQILKRKT